MQKYHFPEGAPANETIFANRAHGTNRGSSAICTLRVPGIGLRMISSRSGLYQTVLISTLHTERIMRFIALAKFRTKLTDDIVAQNIHDIEEDVKDGIQYQGIYWTLGKYDTVVIFVLSWCPRG